MSRSFGSWVVVAVAASSGACASARVPPPPPPIPEAEGGRPDQVIFPNSEYAGNGVPVYRVWYGTNRRPIDPRDESRGYSGERDSTLHYGNVIVSIPESHRFGSIGSSWAWRVLRVKDDRLKIETIQPRVDADFFDFMRDKLGTREPGKRTALVYIHGFNTTFEEAAIRAAQMGYDLKVEGVTAFYSWPSAGETYQYSVDEATIGASEPYLADFLQRIVHESDAERVDVIAHSMGNRGLLRVLQTLQADSTVRFGQIILAAPDVDAQTFRNLADVYPRVSDRTTLYVSSKDRALQLSGIFHDYARAGFTPPVTVLDGISTVEVSRVDLTLLGHGYFAEAADVLYDMFLLLQRNLGPEARRLLLPATNAAGRVYHVLRN